tara:strand:+ start:288 stop:539 length:252 start_codon:yes stop_codon:yes gene_type:complete
VPKYCYKCKECEVEFEVRHSIKEKLYDCKTCDNEQSLQRIPQLTNIPKSSTVGKQKAGSLVKEFIEANREVLKEQKEQRKDYE